MASSTGWSCDGSGNTAQHFARRRLVLEGLCQLARPRLHLLEQPRVLDGDYGLVGEGLHEHDLCVAEWLHLRLREGQHANRLALAQKWDRKQRSNFSDDNLVLATELGFGLKIGHMHGAPFEHGPSGERGAIRGYRVILQILCKRRIDDRVREQIEFSLSPAPQGSSFGRAEALGSLRNGVDHRLSGGERDNIQDPLVAV